MGLAVPALILLGSGLPRAWKLSRGPGPFIRTLAAMPLEEVKDPLLRQRLRNVVEEMAIASGLPMPQVFLIEEPGINACTLGHDAHHAAIAVTRGAVTRLQRQELLALMAHEFAHIVNGDIRLNTRMLVWMGSLFGVAQCGRALLLGVLPGRRPGLPVHPAIFLIRAVPFFVLGLAAYVLGFFGWFFGKLL